MFGESKKKHNSDQLLFKLLQNLVTFIDINGYYLLEFHLAILKVLSLPNNCLFTDVVLYLHNFVLCKKSLLPCNFSCKSNSFSCGKFYTFKGSF